MTTATLIRLTPEILVIAVAVAIYLGGAFLDADRTWRWLAGGVLAMAAGLLVLQQDAAPAAGPFQFDALAWQGRWFALAAGALLVPLAARPSASGGTSEYIGSLLVTVAGLMSVAAANELVLLFVGLELISIPTYVLLYLGRRDSACQEAMTKYFFLSVLSSAVLLYGFSFLYGATGSTDLVGIRAALASAGAEPGPLVGLAGLAFVLVFAGLCFKIAAVPFHFYAPDVYQGTTYPNAALLSVVPKAAGLLAMIRVLILAMPEGEPYRWQIVAAVAAVTMTLGNVLALWQDNLRRLLAYSSIAHTGYMLIGLAVALAAGSGPSDWSGTTALAFYLATYAAATTGTFAVLEYLGRPGRDLEGVEELAGLSRTRPRAAAMLAVFLFSLAGVPVLAGFWGKLLLFGSALGVGGAGEGMQAWFVGLAVVGVLNAAVAAAYYLRIVAVMYFRTPLATPRAEGGSGAWAAAVACAVLVIAVGLYPGPLMRAVPPDRVAASRFHRGVLPSELSLRHQHYCVSRKGTDCERHGHLVH